MGFDSSQVIRIYTTRLVNTLVPIEFGDEYRQSLISELLSQLSRDSNQHSIPTKDINQVIQDYKRRFISSGRQTEWVKFQSIISTLSQMKSTTQVKNYLIFLNTLKGMETEPNQEIKSSGFNNLSSPGLSSASSFMNPRSAQMGLESSPYKRDLDFKNNAVMGEAIKPYYQTLDESFILQYVSYMLMGIDSKIITFIDDGSDIKVNIPSSINNSYSLLLAKLLEPALIYIKLKKVLSMAFGSGLTPVKTSFLSLLEKELVNYSNFITNNSLHFLSLLKTYNILFPVLLKLRLFYDLSSQLDLSGYDFLQATYRLTKYGDNTIRKLSQDIFNSISNEYYEILENWILRGELIDVNREFFVEFNEQEDSIQDIIVYLPRKVPNFFIIINKDIGFKIFQIGKILIFLSKYCRELQWVNNYSLKYSRFVLEEHSGLKTMDINIINKLVSLQYNELVNYLTFVIHGKFELIHHLKNYKKFLLMSSNDFIDALMVKGFELFNQPSNQLTSNQLSKILVESVNSSSIKNYDIGTKNRLDARILNLSHGNIGWQVFTLEYKIDDLPISSIINYKDSNIEYLKMFNFLWKLKQASFVLHLNYIESSNLKRNDLKNFGEQYIRLKRQESLGYKDMKIKYLMRAFKTVNLIRFRLVSFLNNLTDYLLGEVNKNCDTYINGFFKVKNKKAFTLNPQFKNTIYQNTTYLPQMDLIESNINEMNFDTMIEKNSNYIQKFNLKILDNSYSGKSGESYIDQIYRLFEIIYQFIGSDEEFHTRLIEYVTLLNIDRHWELEEIDNDFNYVESRLKEIVNKINFEIFKEFKLNFEILVKDLKSDLDFKDLSKVW